MRAAVRRLSRTRRSFVMGRPAKVVRPVRDADLAGIREAGSRYVQYAQEFRSACKRV